jgi:hypothetical protein
MVMSSKKIGRMVGADVDKALADIGSARPDMKDEGAELKAAVAPKNDLSFAEAFKANRMAGNKTFTWKGKSYATKMAGEGASRSAAASSTPTRRETPKASPKVSEATSKFVSKLPLKPKAETPAAAAKPKGSSYLSGVGGSRSAAATAARKEGTAGKDGMFDRFSRWVHQTNLNQQERQKKKYGYAKGGKIDGIAVRGKTRAGRK